MNTLENAAQTLNDRVCHEKGKYEVQFKLKKQDPYFTMLHLPVTVFCLSTFKDVPISKLGEHEFNRKNPIGTGPFKFKEWKEGQYVKVEALMIIMPGVLI
ncbi:ABC transporter substrate-binding protein [Bacillus licheniformis]|nr:ABC transporter substrate-binding protein [Bacillus licheniformis]